MRSTSFAPFTLVLSAALVATMFAGPAPAADPTAAAVGQTCSPDPVAPKRQLRADWIASVEQHRLAVRARPDAGAAEGRAVGAARPGRRPQAQRRHPPGAADRGRVLAVAARAVVEVPHRHPGRRPGLRPAAPSPSREAHARNLEFHAWFNPYRVSMDTDRTPWRPTTRRGSTPTGWSPTAASSTTTRACPRSASSPSDAIMDAVTQLRHRRRALRRLLLPLPGGGPGFPDDADLRAVRRRLPRHWRDWRRDNIDLLIRSCDSGSSAAKPWVKFGVSPFAVWRNKATDPEGSETHRRCADLRRPVRRHPPLGARGVDRLHRPAGLLGRSASRPPTTPCWSPWWSDQVRGHRRAALHRPGDVQGRRLDAVRRSGWTRAELSDHLSFNRDHPRGRRRHLLLRQGRARQPAGPHGHRAERALRPPSAGPSHRGRAGPRTARGHQARRGPPRRRRPAVLARRRIVVRRLSHRPRLATTVRPARRHPPGRHRP